MSGGMIYYDNSNDVQKEFIKNKISECCVYNQSYLVDGMLKNGTFEFEDIEDGASSMDLFDIWRDELEMPVCEELLKDAGLDVGLAGEDWDCIEAHCKDNDLENEFFVLEESVKEKHQERSDESEIFEWWLLDCDWTAGKLIQAGEKVLKNEYGTWWGRQCTGQAIKLDPTFWIIFQEGVAMRSGDDKAAT